MTLLDGLTARERAITNLLLNPSEGNINKHQGALAPDRVDELLAAGMLNYDDLRKRVPARLVRGKRSGQSMDCFWANHGLTSVVGSVTGFSGTPEDADRSGSVPDIHGNNNAQASEGGLNLATVDVPLWTVWFFMAGESAALKTHGAGAAAALNWFLAHQADLGVDLNSPVIDSSGWRIERGMKNILTAAGGRWRDVLAEQLGLINTPSLFKGELSESDWLDQPVRNGDGDLQSGNLMDLFAKRNLHDWMAVLVRDGWDINRPDPDGNTHLTTRSEWATAKKLLALGADPISCGTSGRSVWDAFKQWEMNPSDRKACRTEMIEVIEAAAKKQNLVPEVIALMNAFSAGVIGECQDACAALMRMDKTQVTPIGRVNGRSVGETVAAAVLKSFLPESLAARSEELIKRMHKNGWLTGEDAEQGLDDILLARVFSCPDDEEINPDTVNRLTTRWPDLQDKLFDWALRCHPLGVFGMMARLDETDKSKIVFVPGSLKQLDHEGAARILIDAPASLKKTASGDGIGHIFDHKDGHAPWIRSIGEQLLANDAPWLAGGRVRERLPETWVRVMADWRDDPLWAGVVGQETLARLADFARQDLISYRTKSHHGRKSRLNRLSNANPFTLVGSPEWAEIMGISCGSAAEIMAAIPEKCQSWSRHMFDELHDRALLCGTGRPPVVAAEALAELRIQSPERSWAADDPMLPKFTIWRGTVANIGLKGTSSMNALNESAKVFMERMRLSCLSESQKPRTPSSRRM